MMISEVTGCDCQTQSQDPKIQLADLPLTLLQSSPFPPSAAAALLCHLVLASWHCCMELDTCTSLKSFMLNFLRPKQCTPVPGDTAVNRTREHGTLHFQNPFCIPVKAEMLKDVFRLRVITGRALGSLQFRSLGKICMVHVSHNCCHSRCTACCPCPPGCRAACPRAQSRDHTFRNSLSFTSFDAVRF